MDKMLLLIAERFGELTLTLPVMMEVQSNGMKVVVEPSPRNKEHLKKWKTEILKSATSVYENDVLKSSKYVRQALVYGVMKWAERGFEIEELAEVMQRI